MKVEFEDFWNAKAETLWQTLSPHQVAKAFWDGGQQAAITPTRPYSTYELSETQVVKYLAFCKRHKYHQNVGVEFRPTGIGNGVAYRCGGCGIQEDDSEVERW